MYKLKIVLEEKGKVPKVRYCDDFEISDDLEIIKVTRFVRNTEFVEVLSVDWFSKISIIPLRHENNRA